MHGRVHGCLKNLVFIGVLNIFIRTFNPVAAGSSPAPFTILFKPLSMQGFFHGGDVSKTPRPNPRRLPGRMAKALWIGCVPGANVFHQNTGERTHR